MDKRLRRMDSCNPSFMRSERDHTLRMQKHRCKNPECNWQSTPTTSTVFGTDTHPDLAKLQCEQGALYSYREAQGNLEKLNCHRRSVNNHVQIQHITNQVGERLSQENQQSLAENELPEPTQDLIVQVDGGHISIKDKAQRSFEALLGIVYRPSRMEAIDRHHRQITKKSCVISALDDELHTIKTYLHNAALRQGMSQETHVTALADGARNCWSIIFALQPHCQNLEPILDWFHIGKKFQNVLNALGEAFQESLSSAKWKLWHGEAAECLSKIALIRENVADENKRSQLMGLHDYLQRNLAYLVNYDQREKANKTYTSQAAESHIDVIINLRHKRKKKMQWTREGAHNVLQIRAMMVSKEWDNRWLDLVLPDVDRAA